MVVYICSEMRNFFLQLLITNLTSHNLKMELCNIRAYSQSRYPIEQSNRKKDYKGLFWIFITFTIS